ncbi:MAG: chitobiase/beta-hexosaminidase, partial [Deltaproteobacteria bacterium]|nr:chitobiase/beta-hexosaminidase [Deltaproteobacteria bacterium]
GVGPAGSSPESATGWTFSAGGPNGGYNFSQNNDEHMATLRAPAATGSYSYVWRFRRSAGWTYCDTDGSGSNGGLDFSASKLGTLTVQ